MRRHAPRRGQLDEQFVMRRIHDRNNSPGVDFRPAWKHRCRARRSPTTATPTRPSRPAAWVDGRRPRGARLSTTATPATDRRDLDQGHPRKWWILVAVSVGMFMALLDVTIVNIAIPRHQSTTCTPTCTQRLVGAERLQPRARRVVPVDGPHRRQVRPEAGLHLRPRDLHRCSRCSADWLPTIGWLIAFRAGQGLGGAALLTISLAIVLGAFPRRQQGMAVGLWGALGTAAAAVGPTLGGLLVTYGELALDLLRQRADRHRGRRLRRPRDPRSRPAGACAGGIDVPGIAIAAAGLFLLTLALVQGNSWGWRSPGVLGLFAAAVACLSRVHVVGASHSSHPMFPLEAAAHPLVHGGQHAPSCSSACRWAARSCWSSSSWSPCWATPS